MGAADGGGDVVTVPACLFACPQPPLQVCGGCLARLRRRAASSTNHHDDDDDDMGQQQQQRNGHRAAVSAAAAAAAVAWPACTCRC